MTHLETHKTVYYDRNHEVELIEDIVALKRKKNHNLQRIVNFFAISGLGKSALINKIKNNLQCELLAVVINSNSSTTKISPLLEKINCHLNTQKNSKLLLLIDDYDKLPLDVQEACENKILNKIIKNPYATAVLTSHASLSYRNQKNLSYYTLFQELKSFTPSVVKKQYQNYVDLIPSILKITAGLPLCVEKAMAYIQERNISTLPEFLRHEKEVITLNYDIVIRNVIAKEIVTDNANLIEIICVLSILRRFNIDLMRYLFPEVTSPYIKLKDITYMNSIDDMRNLVFVSWTQGRCWYTLRRSVRQILLYYMQNIHLQKVIAINMKLQNFYANKIKEPVPKTHHLVEYFYHTLFAMQLDQKEASSERDIQRKFSANIRRYFTTYKSREPSIDSLNTFKESLENDEDMRDYITEEVQELMEQTLKSWCS